MVDSENRVYIGNLDYETTTEALAEFVGRFATCSNVRVPFDNVANRNKGFAFVSVETAADAEALIATLNGKAFNGRTLRVAPAVPRGY